MESSKPEDMDESLQVPAHSQDSKHENCTTKLTKDVYNDVFCSVPQLLMGKNWVFKQLIVTSEFTDAK